MSHLGPVTLTPAEQRLILRTAAANIRDHTIFSMALATDLRLAELVGLNVGDVFAPNGTSRIRVRIRPEIEKGGRAADVFLPDRLVTALKRCRVGGGVAAPAPHRPGRADFPHPVRHGTGSLVTL